MIFWFKYFSDSLIKYSIIYYKKDIIYIFLFMNKYSEHFYQLKNMIKYFI